jgi:hypothetical protein
VARKPTQTRKPDLKVEVPDPDADRPRLGRVGIVAGVGFALGIVFPWAAGIQFVPTVPADDGPPTGASPPSSASAATPQVAKAAPPPAPVPAAASAEGPPPEQRIKIGAATVTSCRDAKGGKVDQCDTPAFDAVARTRLAALAGCPAGADARGMLSLGFEVDFSQKKVTRVLRGASTTLPKAAADGIVQCATQQFASASLDGMKHAEPSYTIFYPVEFLVPPPAPAPVEPAEAKDAGNAVTAASGMATVSWSVAIIRDAPNKDAGRVARVAGGTRVTVVGRQNDWYKIKYDAKGSEGWVYKGAIGL